MRKRFWVRLVMLLIVFFPFQTFSGTILDGAIMQYREENFEEALELLKKAETLEPSTLVYFYLGLTYKQLGNLNEAKRYLELSLTSHPPVLDAYPEIIETLYSLERTDEARFWLEEAKKKGLFPAKIAFLEGLILFRQNLLDKAREAFFKAKSLDKDLAQAADLQIALTYASERKIEEARKTFKALIEIDPRSEIAEFARDYLSSLEKIAVLYRRWTLSLGAGFLYDDNVVLKPKDDTGISAVDEITKKSDKGIFANLRMQYRSQPVGRFSVVGDLSLGAREYSRLHTHDTAYGSIRLTPNVHLNRGVLAAPLEYYYMLLDDRRYMSLFSFRPTYTFPFQRKHVGQFSAGFARRDMFKYLKYLDPDENRDSNIYNLLLAYYYPFREEKGLFWSRYEYQVNDSKGRNWISHSHRVTSGLIYPVTDRFGLSVTGEFTQEKFRRIHSLSGRNINGFPSEPERREDLVYGLSFGAFLEISKSLKLNLSYARFRADSNFILYDYRRNLFTADMVYFF